MNRDDGFIYLATAYSSPDPAVREERFRKVTRCAALLMQRHLHVFSPITHSHPIATAETLPGDWAYWEKYDRKMLAFCSEMLILDIPGWKESTGVTAEIKIAKDFGIPIQLVSEEGQFGEFLFQPAAEEQVEFETDFGDELEDLING